MRWVSKRDARSRCARRLAAAASGTLLGAALLACAPPPEPAGRLWEFPEYEIAVRLPEDWRTLDAYALYARQRRVPEEDVRTRPLADAVREVGFLLVARPPASEGASRVCAVNIKVEDLTSYPNITDVEAYAGLAERAASKYLSGYERLSSDVPLKIGQTAALRREVRALQLIGRSRQPVRNVTLFIKRGKLGFAVEAYELEQEFDSRRSQFDAILDSVRLGPPPPEGIWSRWLCWLPGRSD